VLLVLGIILDLSFSFLFLLSVYHKWTDLRGFRDTLLKAGIVNSRLLSILPIVVIASELCIVLGYAGGWIAWATSSFTAAVLVAFSIFLLVQRRQGGTGCKCFGSESSLNRYPLTRNTVLLALVAIHMILPAYRYAWHETIVFLLLISAVLMFYLASENVKRIRKLKLIGAEQ